MSPECLKDLNELINSLIILACQYKACMRDFLATNDKGIADFLRAEKIERYQMSNDIADYIQKFNGKGVVYSSAPAPTHGAANPAMLQTLVKLEKAVLDKLDIMISMANDRGSEITKQYMVMVRNKLQKEYNEVQGIINEISVLASDPGSMAYYNNFLEKEYEKGYE